MSEEDVRDGLRDAVVGEPPLDFDPDALVTTARQQVRRRRALLAAGVATVAVVAAAVAIPAALGRDGTRVAAPPASTTTRSVTKSPSALPGHYTVADLRQRGQEMRAHLREVVPVVLPAASEFEYGEFGGEAAGEFYEGQTSVNAPVSFTIDHARYSLVVTVWTPDAPSMTPDEVCAGGTGCKRLPDHDGDPVVLRTEDYGDQTISTLYHFRKDGGVVQVGAYNYDMASSGSQRYMSTIPVTLEQLTTLATDPDLGL